MELLSWIDEKVKDKAREEVINELAEYIGRSQSTLNSYIYGYRSIPKDLQFKLVNYTGNVVSIDELNAPRARYLNKDNSKCIALCPSLPNRTLKPIITINLNNSSETEKLAFVNCVNDLVFEKNNKAA